jgi:arylsulfatase A-like enzyme
MIRRDFGGRRTLTVSNALMVGVVMLSFACGGGPPEGELDRELDRLLQRTRHLAARARDFDHDRVLLDIGSDPANGTLYRLDEHLKEASREQIGGSTAEAQSVLAVPDLELDRTEPGGIVVCPVDLRIRDVGSLELQIVSSQGDRVEIELQSELTGEVVKIGLDVVGDGALHTYRLELAETLATWTGNRLVSLRLRIPDSTEAEMFEIRSASFQSQTAAYADATHGVVSHRLGGETRRSIFQWSSSALRFPVEIEHPIEVELEVGVAALLMEAPVRVGVTLIDEGNSRHLLSTVVDGGDGWTDRRLPLGLLRSGRHVIELRVAAETPNVVFWSNPAVVFHPERRFNVIMVLEDALRADHLSCYGYDRQTTPVKDVFARRGVRFARCYAQATKTRFSCPSFMTSLYPTATGVEGIWHPHPSLHENYVTLAEVLRRRGFVTASFHQNPNAGSPAGLDQGFSYLYERVGGRAESLYAGAPTRWIEAHRHRNFMLYIHVADPHEPYDPPADFRNFFRDFEATAVAPSGAHLDRRDPQWMQGARRALYDGEIRHNDHWFASFLESLEKLGLSDDTLIVFMADHGERLGEHGLWSHNPPSYVQVLHTPLIMVYPQRIPGGIVVDEIVQNLDIMPTILELAGVDGGALLMQGDSLLSLMVEDGTDSWNRNIGYAEEALLKKSREDPRPWGSVFFDRWHLLDSLHAPGKLFDLARDPAENRPLRPTRHVRQRTEAFLRAMQVAELEIWRGVTRGEDSAVTLDPETLGELKMLGYLK